MFQVASHPSSFGLHAHSHHQTSPSAPSSVQLPRNLSRPAFVEVSREAIISAAPELADVPVEYIRRGLRPKVNEMLAAISALAPSHLPSSLPRSHLPPSLSIPIRGAAAAAQLAYPTHVLAVQSSKSAANDHLLIFPVHALVLALHCSSLPSLPASNSHRSSSTLHLPVLPISLPSPAAFNILNAFMYTHRLDTVLKSLFPVPNGFLQTISHQAVRSAMASGHTLHQLSAYLCASASSNLKTLTVHAAHVKDLWQDMVALGMYDPELWDTIDLAWEVVLGALNLAAAASH